MSFEFFPLLDVDVPLAWTWTPSRPPRARAQDRGKEKKNDGRRRLFENGARLACSLFVYGVFCARALHEDERFGETFCGAKAVEKHFEKSCGKDCGARQSTTKSTRTKNPPLPNTRRTRRRRRRRLRFHRRPGDAHLSVLSTNRESQT